MIMTFELMGMQLRRMADAESLTAASALLPPGSYTTFRTYSGNRVLRLEQHVRRLQESAALLNLHGDLDYETVRAGLGQVIQIAGYTESRFRLTFSPPRFFLSVEPFTPYPPQYYTEGVRCITVGAHRDNPHAKSTSFIASAGSAYHSLPASIHEGLMVAGDGAVLEGLSSSFFALLGGVLHTEQCRALVGVTQSLVLELARAIAPQIALSTHAVQLADLPRVQECFITSVSREIMPVVQIDDTPVADGRPGPLTRNLMQGLHDLIMREAQSVLD